MTIRGYLIIVSAILISCGTRTYRTSSHANKLEVNKEQLIVEEAWMNFDTVDHVSYIDLHKYGRLKLPGRWKYSDGQPPRFFDYENSENHLLRVDRGRLDTMSFYSKKLTKAEVLNELYEQGVKLWRQRKGDFKTIDQNLEFAISKLTIDSTQQIFFLCGIKEKKSMSLYLVPKKPNDKESVDLLKKIFSMWKQ